MTLSNVVLATVIKYIKSLKTKKKLSSFVAKIPYVGDSDISLDHVTNSLAFAPKAAEIQKIYI